ncbi:cytosolic phospholipase A2-like isoform X2 [Montipora capricornis]
MDSHRLRDDLVDAEAFELNDLEIDKPYFFTFKFRKLSEVDVEMKVGTCIAPFDLRYGLDLCDEEKEFIQKRKQVVFEAMKKFLGNDGPKNLNEVPNIAVLGSGGGFRAMVSLSGVFCALKDMGLLDCTMYAAGLSGSAWYLSTLYSHPEWPNCHPRKTGENLGKNVEKNWLRMMLTPSWLRNRLKDILKKKSRGQPVSFTDFFGYLISDTILKDRSDVSKLSDQRVAVKDAAVPLPLYNCVHVKKDVSAQTFCEWMEFSPYEIGMDKYGTFMKTEHFGSKFFCGKLLTPYPEPTLAYLQGIWGSAFTILLQRILNEGRLPDDTNKRKSNAGDLRQELDGMINSEDVLPAREEEHSDEEEDLDVTDGKAEEELTEVDDKDHKCLRRITETIVEKIPFLKTRSGRAGLVHNFMRGLQVILTAPVHSVEEVSEAADLLSLQAKRIYLVDSGLVFNSPYTPLLRPERDVDIFFSFDFSARDKDDEMPFSELLLAEKWARKNHMKFPPIDAEEQYKKYGMKEFYLFSDPDDPTCPVIVHVVLINKTFKDQKLPGVARETHEEKKFGDFSVFEDPDNHYSTFNFHYPQKSFDRLQKLNEFNTVLAEHTIRDVIADGVKRRRQRLAVE